MVSGIALHYFKTLEDVLMRLGLIEKKSARKTGAGKKGTGGNTKKKTK